MKRRLGEKTPVAELIKKNNLLQRLRVRKQVHKSSKWLAITTPSIVSQTIQGQTLQAHFMISHCLWQTSSSVTQKLYYCQNHSKGGPRHSKDCAPSASNDWVPQCTKSAITEEIVNTSGNWTDILQDHEGGGG